jgi:UPF0716 protein FxsA
MALLLVILFLAVPVAELALIVTVANGIGVLNTLGLLVLVSVVGAWLAKREGLGVFRRVQAALDRGELPSREVADGFLILFAGALMITPGFLSDCLALLLLLPPTRAVARGVLVSAVARRGRMAVVDYAGRGFGAGGGGFGTGRRDDGVWDADSWEEPSARSRRGPRPPHELGGDS